MEKMMNKKTEGNTFTKKIGQTVYVVRYHFNEDAKETMQEKINRMLVTGKRPSTKKSVHFPSLQFWKKAYLKKCRRFSIREKSQGK